MKYRFILVISILCIFITLSGASKWEGKIPPMAESAEKWRNLLEKLIKEESYYSAMVTASRMLVFFEDLQTKEAAYRAIVTVSNRGFQFSTKMLYITGDIEPRAGYDFVNTYNLYKGIVNAEKGLEKWAEHYFRKVDTKNFQKYLFYKAIKAYEKRDLKNSILLLKSLLRKDLGKGQKVFAKKVARTLARIYFELENYERSLDIYRGFLLRTNPIQPTDWLEAAWNYYHLQKYERSIGMLYNLESKSFSEVIQLEKYILRALIYRDVCRTDFMEGLANSFHEKFGTVIDGVKTGVSLSTFDEINLLSSHQNPEFFKYNFIEKMLKKEFENTSISEQDLELYEYIVFSERKILLRNAQLFVEESRHESMKYLILLAENLKFLKFDAELEKYNPDMVFSEKKHEKKDKKEKPFSFYWPQDGSYWADERINYKGILENKCQIQ